MRQRKRIFGLTWVAVAAVGLAMPHAARAQYRVGTDGHELDANNRIGSGGFNSPALIPNNTQASPGITLGNNFGNYSGIGSFAGSEPDRDPRGFTGALPGSPSDVLRQISGTSSPGAAPTYNVPQPYYNEMSQVAPPTGFQAVPYTGSYTQAPPPTRQPQDYRLGNTLDTPVASAAPIGQVAGPGPVDPMASMTPTFLNDSPIYGVRDMSPGLDGSNYTYANANQGVSAMSLNNGYSSQLSQADVFRMRGELSQSAPWQPPLNSQVGVLQTTTPAVGVTPTPIGPLAGTQAVTPPNLTTDAAVAVTPIAGEADGSTGQTSRRYLPPLPPPEQQSAQYAKLQSLLQKYQATQPKNDQDANRIFQAQLRLRREYEQSQQQQEDLNAPPPEMPTPAEPAPDLTAPTPPAPEDVGSIGEGIRAAGLSQLVQEGEDLARHQKFKDAISKFIDAREVAPNNMLIAVDLANAELGAGFYREAEQYLRDAFTIDPALLMGRYDIKGLLGADRLQAVNDELKHIATGSDSSTAVFLLAYLSYNTGQTDLAVGYLRLAQVRAGGNDLVIRALMDHWALPRVSATTQPGQ